MLKSVATLAFVAMALPSWAEQAASHYRFDVLYSGQGQATLAGGSADPRGLQLMPGDSFDWTITAQGGAAWTALSDSDVYPLMAFATQEAAQRSGDFALTLTLTGAAGAVLQKNQLDASMAWVHLGTNTIGLASGLRFDTMHLNFVLHSSLEDPDTADDPLNLQTVPTTLIGLLPIFGTPEHVDANIVYGPVPEPATWALLLGGAALLGWRARRTV